MALRLCCKECLQTNAAIKFFRQAQLQIATFSFSKFAHVLDIHATTTVAAFSGCNLSEIQPALRGHILEDVGRTIYQRHYPNSHITDPVPGYRCDGVRRSQKQAEFDWMCDKIRVQCKSGQISLDRLTQKWRCRFAAIKPHTFDQLFLVLYTPKKLHFICYNGRSGLVSDGSRTASQGYKLSYIVPASIKCPRLAKSWILERMQQQSCTIIDSLCTSSHLVVQKVNAAMCTKKHQLESTAFAHHPVGDIHPARRGLIIQAIVQQIDESYHNIATFSASGRSPFDWCRDGLRIECKHTRIAWCSFKRSWVCRFSGVKMDRFDILYLALDAPVGIHVLKFRGAKYLNRTGVCEESIGKAIQIYGPRNETSWSVALADIMNKLTKSGSEHIATVKW